MKHLFWVPALLALVAGSARAQYQKVWETEVTDPSEALLIGIADTDGDSSSEMVLRDVESGTDQTSIIRILDAATGAQEWESDAFYHIYVEPERAGCPFLSGMVAAPPVHSMRPDG
jgi:hypothetical protein